ncbi:two-component system response regulator [Colwellia sp. 39_35_sub15_T18]|nr:two-component system response regulator [Colwellia sp. 39_35_sub15_T18]
MKSLVLLVEDDIDLATTIIDYLQLEDIICDHAANGAACLQLIYENQYDVILLDVNMPRMDGLTVCKTLREQGVETAILMLTARDTLEDKLAGFHAGSDDYMVKPFEMLELVARIQVLSKRRSGQSMLLNVDELKVNFSEKAAKRAQRDVLLSPTGWILLETLMRKSPQVVSRRQLLQAVWGDESPDSNSLKVHLFKLRQQIDAAGETKLMHTIVGQGVVLRKKIDG